MLAYDEKRDFIRMAVQCPARYRLPGAEVPAAALAEDLSGNGIALLTGEPIGPGTELRIEVLPGKAITPPLAAEARVVRCTPFEGNRYRVACSLERVLDEKEIGPEFP